MLNNIVMLCGLTARSSAYLQALSDADIKPDKVIVYGSDEPKLNTNRSLSIHPLHNMFCPDVTLDALHLVGCYGWPHVHLPDKSLNSKTLANELAELKPTLIIYSGYGGQLVPPRILDICPVLHIHSGWLPDYRGSTTVYHEIIEHGRCSASALFLDRTIDTGPILMRQSYPLPPKGIDVDYLYDNAIRANLLVKVLNSLQTSEKGHIIEQAGHYAQYYIVHPLLKHLALLSIDAKEK